MNTEDDLRAGLLEEGIGMAEHEILLIGLADDALSRAQTQRRARRRGTFALAAAVLAAAGVSASVLAAGRSKAVGPVRPVPSTAPSSTQALLEFGTYCPDPNGDGAMSATPYAWDPTARKYRVLSARPQPVLVASPDGSRAVVLTKDTTSGVSSWAVASWPDAVASRDLRFHRLATVGGERLAWTPDGRELVSQISENPASSQPNGFRVSNTEVDFFDPGTGAVHQVAFPAAVTGLMAGKWALSGWTGNEDSLQYYLLSPQGDAIRQVDQQGVTVRTVRLQTGGWRPSRPPDNGLRLLFSPSGRYVMIVGGTVTSVYDLQDQGKLQFRSTDGVVGVWAGPDRYVTAAGEFPLTGTTVARTGITTTYSEHTSDGKVVRSEKLALPQDPQGECSSYPISYGPASVFPGAFLP